jgi:DNA-binding transcriptional ArsR family regulator
VLDRTTLESVARWFRILAEPTRLELLQALKAGPQTVTELTEILASKQANVSKQLGILHTAHLVAREREGNLVRYTLADPMVFELCRLVCGKLKTDAERHLPGLRRGARKAAAS